MLPQLIAEESIQASNRVALGSGTLAKNDARQLIARWQRGATGGSDPKPLAPRATPEMLSALGIGYHVVESQTATGDTA